ncbi:MAG: beta-lactamase family protein [Kordiimonadaceae bacterium]|jgi:D-alanyl-D-alanine carboxypeptidase|nr:beta-lactamase family protein [Kordiimonadaceae bacterium]MBT6031561.1 beta-lactamase family protein [Kordiimonadaceae bacterium]
MNLLKYIILSFTLLLTPSVAQDNPELDGEMARALIKVTDNIVPGISVAIANSDGVVWSGTSGYSNIEEQNSVSQSHLFGIGDLSNYYLAAVLFQMAEEKMLDLNATPQSILGEKVSHIENADSATLYQLLNHTSGIYSWAEDKSWRRRGRGVQMNPRYRWEKDEVLKYISKDRHPANNKPGEAYAYSKSNYTLLGLIIEQVSGGVIEDQVRNRILDPLGLSDTYYHTYEVVPYGQLIGSYHLATSQFISEVGINSKFEFGQDDLINTSNASLSAEGIGGGIVTTPRDLVLFASALRNGKILNEQSMKLFNVGNNHSQSDILGFTADMHWLENKLTIVSFINLGTVNSGDSETSTLLNSYMDKILLPIARKYAK